MYAQEQRVNGRITKSRYQNVLTEFWVFQRQANELSQLKMETLWKCILWGIDFRYSAASSQGLRCQVKDFLCDAIGMSVYEHFWIIGEKKMMT